MDMKKTVGVLGGLGPKASVYFFDLVVELTDAKVDQDHVDMIIVNRASTPDRTAYIIGESKENPAEQLIKDARRLEKAGVDFIVLACNTAHYFFPELEESIQTPLVNMVEETVKQAKEDGHQKVGILATTGNIKTGLYQEMCKKYQLGFEILDSVQQRELMSIIYDDVKSGKDPNMEKFRSIITNLRHQGCDGVILGCTELSIINKDYQLDRSFYIDSSEVLAMRTIEGSGSKMVDRGL